MAGFVLVGVFPCAIRQRRSAFGRIIQGVYYTHMGLISLGITLLIMVLGAGYYFFGASQTTKVFVNEQNQPVTNVALYEDLKEQANDIKETEEERVEQEIATLEEALTEKIQKNTSQKQEMPDITDRFMTSGFSVPNKARTIDTLVLHSSYNPNGEAYSVSALVKIYESYGVSAHYLIDRAGKIYRLVEDNNVAYHAGVSKMPDGRQDVNDFSIGIEIMNKEDTKFTEAQYEAVNVLVASLKQKHGIKYIVGHNNIAPERKTDPWNFDWKQLP